MSSARHRPGSTASPPTSSTSTAVTRAGKVYYAGEYAWTATGGDQIAGFLSAAQSEKKVSGDSFWSLFPHSATGGYVQHGDGYTLHYPGDSPDMARRAQLIRRHGYAMSGRPEPAHGRPGVPAILAIDGRQITWRGATLGYQYSIERSAAGAAGPWTIVCDKCAGAGAASWTDDRQTGGTDWYRIRAFNVAGAPGDYSGVASVRVP